MTPCRLFALFAAALPLLTGCAVSYEPFVDSTPLEIKRGQVQVCYTLDTPPERVAALADAECGRFNQVAQLVNRDKYQCRLDMVGRSTFKCVYPPGREPPGKKKTPAP